MVQSVGDNGIFSAEQRFKQTAVGIEARGVQDGIFHAEETGQLLLQRFVAVLRSADEADGSHTKPVAVHTRFRRVNQFRMVGQAKVVVGAEVDDAAAVADRDIRLLGGSNDTFFFEQTLDTRGLQVVR